MIQCAIPVNSWHRFHTNTNVSLTNLSFFLRYKSIVHFICIPTMLSMRVWFTNSLYLLLHGMNMILFYRCDTTWNTGTNLLLTIQDQKKISNHMKHFCYIGEDCSMPKGVQRRMQIVLPMKACIESNQQDWCEQDWYKSKIKNLLVLTEVQDWKEISNQTKHFCYIGGECSMPKGVQWRMQIILPMKACIESNQQDQCEQDWYKSKIKNL